MWPWDFCRWDTESSVLDRSKGNKRNWILVWEDGFCDFQACARAANGPTSPTPNDDHPVPESTQYMQPELFFKMSHEVYNYGEGMMGKVAADNGHKWVYKEPLEADPMYPPWQGTLDPHPRTWEAQFKSRIETIAIIAVKEGLIQLGSIKKTVEDLNFVLYVRRKFSYLQSIPGVYAMNSVQIQGGTREAMGSYNGETSTENHRFHEQNNSNNINNNNSNVYWGGSGEEVLVQYGCESQQQQNILPSMSSSLQALLSRLPSVTSAPLIRENPSNIHRLHENIAIPDIIHQRSCPSTPSSSTLQQLYHHSVNSPTSQPLPLSSLLHPFVRSPRPFNYTPSPLLASPTTHAPPFLYPQAPIPQQQDLLDPPADTYNAMVREGIS